MDSSISFLNNKEQNRFELHKGNHTAVIEYVLQANRFDLLHTYVPTSLRGKGMATILIEKTLSKIDADAMKVIPTCAFVQHYLNKNTKWDHLWK